MSRAVLHGTVNVVSSESSTNEQPKFDNDANLHIYIEDISKVPRTSLAQEHPEKHGSILLGDVTIKLSRENKFPLEFQCEYDPTKASNGRFDELCQQGFITIGAEINGEGREMTSFWLESGEQKFEQNIKLTLTNSYK